MKIMGIAIGIPFRCGFATQFRSAPGRAFHGRTLGGVPRRHETLAVVPAFRIWPSVSVAATMTMCHEPYPKILCYSIIGQAALIWSWCSKNMECPNCGLINLPDALVCDCGYNLHLRQKTTSSEVAKKKIELRLWLWLSWAVNAGNVIATLYFGSPFRERSPMQIVFAVIWATILVCAVIRVKVRGLWLLLGAPFGLLPLLQYLYVLSHPGVFISYPQMTP
ncbi:membrane hypothetical protein [Candidatus Sulfopaludibacter sp. SbA4]|nr:membrane hypothetical protein [Candidatus Sulfopaludibacter sp. SbA4]